MADPGLSAIELQGATRDSVCAWMAEKQMTVQRVGRLWKFQSAEVDKWVCSGDAARADDLLGNGE